MPAVSAINFMNSKNNFNGYKTFNGFNGKVSANSFASSPIRDSISFSGINPTRKVQDPIKYAVQLLKDSTKLDFEQFDNYFISKNITNIKSADFFGDQLQKSINTAKNELSKETSLIEFAKKAYKLSTLNQLHYAGNLPPLVPFQIENRIIFCAPVHVIIGHNNPISTSLISDNIVQCLEKSFKKNNLLTISDNNNAFQITGHRLISDDVNSPLSGIYINKLQKKTNQPQNS